TMVGQELRAHAAEGAFADMIVAMRYKLVQALHEDLGVAYLGQRSAGVAEPSILPLVDHLTNLRPDEPQDSPDLLEALPRLVNGLVARPVGRLAQLFEGGVHFPARDPRDPL